jgi:hypothetical protein
MFFILEKSKMPLLKVRRLRSIAIETFKIIHKESPIYLHDLVNIKKHNYTLLFYTLISSNTTLRYMFAQGTLESHLELTSNAWVANIRTNGPSD